MNVHQFIKLALKKGITNIQITKEKTKQKQIYYINDKLNDYTDLNKTIYIIKAEINKKTEELTSEYLDETIIDLIIEKTELVDAKYEYDFLEKKELKGVKKDKNVSVTKEMSIIKKLNELKKNYKQIKSVEFVFEDLYNETTIINNKGLNLNNESHTYQFYVEALAEKNGEYSSYNQSKLVTKRNEIDFEKITKEVFEKVSIQVEKVKLETKKYNVIIDSSVTASIIASLKNMLSANSIRKKTSCLAEKINNKVFSEKLTIVEEPLNEKYPGHTLFDKEGTETYNKIIVDKGIIKDYLYDIKEAKLVNRKSTGNNYGLINTRNMYIKPTNTSVEKLLEMMQDGIYITDKMGASGTSMNETTGSISIQIFGFLIKNGKIVSGFDPAIMTTTIFEILSNIENIGNDLTFNRKDIGCPSIYVSNIYIASE